MATNTRSHSAIRYNIPPAATAVRERDRFDKDTGLVFRETVVTAPRQMSLPPLNIQPRLPSSQALTTGPPSLQDLAIRTFLAHLDSVSPDLLLNVPWTVGRRIWKHVLEYELARPSLWVAFAAAYPDEEQFRYFPASEIVPSRPFEDYIEYMASPNFQWLTCLTLSKITLGRADIMRLATLSNLLALDVYSSPPGLRPAATTASAAMIDDRVVRDWSIRATEEAAFPRLRVMILRNQVNITARALEFLCAFPALTLVGVKGCALTAQHEDDAQHHGWTAQAPNGLTPTIQSEIDKSHTWDGALTVCVKHSAALLAELNPSAPPDSPILSFRLGHTSNDILYSAPILFFRRRSHQQKQQQQQHPAPKLTNPLTSFTAPDTSMPDAPLEPESQSTTTPPPPHHPHPPLQPDQADPQTDTQPNKKRKIKVSVQRSFGSMLSGFGIDIVQHAASPDPADGPRKGSKDSASSGTSASQPAPWSQQGVIQAPPAGLEGGFEDPVLSVPVPVPVPVQVPEEQTQTQTQTQTQSQAQMPQSQGLLPSKATLAKRRQAREDRQRPWRSSAGAGADAD